MRLFVGNATKQDHIFVYTLPENKKSLQIPIPRGTQAQIPGELSTEDIDHVVSRHAAYGLISQDAIDRAREFHGLCYAIGKPITAQRLTYLVNRNVDELVERGRQTRAAAAVAQNVEFQRALVENDRPEQITNFEVSVQEDRLSDDSNPAPQLAEGLRVVRSGQNPAPKAPRSERRRAA